MEKNIKIEEVELPEGFKFADEASCAAYRNAVAGPLNSMERLPMVVITSDRPGVGKSTLARHILERRYGDVRGSWCFHTDAGILRYIPKALEDGYLWFDEAGPHLFSSRVLSHLLDAKVWEYRPLRAKESVSVTIPEQFQIIVTGCQIDLPDHLANRSILIRLG